MRSFPRPRKHGKRNENEREKRVNKKTVVTVAERKWKTRKKIPLNGDEKERYDM